MGILKSLGRLWAKSDQQIIDTPEKLARALGVEYETHSGQVVNHQQRHAAAHCI